MVSNNNSTFLTADDIVFPSTPAPVVPAKDKAPIDPTNKAFDRPAEETYQFQVPEIHTPSRQKRRATVSVTSPVAVEKLAPEATTSDLGASPSKRREKSKSHSDLLNKRIVPMAVLEAEINKSMCSTLALILIDSTLTYCLFVAPPPEPTPRLSQMIDRNLFIAPPLGSSRDDLLHSHSVDEIRQPSFDELTSSPYRVEPYPQRQNHDVPVLDTPSRHRLEGVYDRFLMATSGVKRLGKGYQSDNHVPVANNKNSLGLNLAQNKARAFYSTRRPMPPPVSSEDLQRRTASVDELGNWSQVEEIPEDPKDLNVGFVRKAIKLMVPKGTTSKRLSRIG
jgi:serine/threonine-protein kinase GIN4